MSSGDGLLPVVLGASGKKVKKWPWRVVRSEHLPDGQVLYLLCQWKEKKGEPDLELNGYNGPAEKWLCNGTVQQGSRVEVTLKRAYPTYWALIGPPAAELGSLSAEQQVPPLRKLQADCQGEAWQEAYRLLVAAQ